MKLALRPYQDEDLDKVIHCWKAHNVNSQLIKYATGLGKTPLFTELPNRINLKGRMMVLLHREELADQALATVKRWCPKYTVGVEMANKVSNGEQIVIAGVQTIGRANSNRIQKFSRDAFEVIVTDEAHHATATTYRNVYNYFNYSLHLGVTATPNRADGTGLNKVYKQITADRDILWGCKNGWLAVPKGQLIRTGANLDNVHTTSTGEFNLEELSSEVDTPLQNTIVADGWLKFGQNRKSIGFTVDIKHAKNLANALKERGVAAEAIWGDDPDRALKKKLHREGYIKVLLNAQLLTEGYDDWEVGCIIWNRPTQSEGFYTQGIGRGTRIPSNISNILEAKAKGIKVEKEDCIVLDCVGSSTKHSLVSLSSLHGMNHDVDFKGKSIVSVVEEIKKLKEAKPYLDIGKLKDINELKTWAESVDLFKVQFAPEVIQLSEYQWHKTGDNAYVLLLANKESVTILKDLLDNWYVIGTVNGKEFKYQYETFEDAIREGDRQVRVFGGRSLSSMVKRSAKWHNDPPTPAQLNACSRMRIKLPPDATKGMVTQLMSQYIARRKGKVA